MKNHKGLTIVQLMVILIIVGIAGSYVVRMIKNKQCEADPSRSSCADRKAAPTKK